MELRVNLDIAKGKCDSKKLKLVSVSAREIKHEYATRLCINDGMNFTIAEVYFGDIESSNAFTEELARRWNEFPEELKK